MAEGFSRAGVPVFTADVKGDLAGIARASSGSEKVDARIKQLYSLSTEFFWSPSGAPTVFWDLDGKNGTLFAARF